MQSPPFGNSRHRVTRLLRSPLLRLKQIDVSASSDVERVPLRAQQMPLLAHQRQVAATDGADEHLPSITGGAVEEIQNSRFKRQSCRPVFLGNAFGVAVDALYEMDVVRALGGFERRVHLLHIQAAV